MKLTTSKSRPPGLADCFVLLLTLSAAGCGSRPGLDASQIFQDAELAFSNAQSADDFARVAGQYDQLLVNGLVSGVAFYNQGNAWMRAGETGRAIAAWRQSQRYRPRDPYLNANLQSALMSCQSQASVAPETGVAGYVFFWQNLLSYPEKFFLATVLLTVLCLSSLLNQFLAPHQILNRLTVFVGVLFVVAAISATWDWQRYDQTTSGVVVLKEIEARKGNSESYEAAFTAPLSEGSEFVVLEERTDWLNIRIPGLDTAWIPSGAAAVF